MTAGTAHESVDVAIVGGGPTGLFTGLLLQRMGVSVCILDAKPTSLDLGRADALNARTQQYFEVTNLLHHLLPLGLKCNTSSTFANGDFKSRQNQWWVSLEHTLHKNFLMLGQPVIEKLLSDELGHAVRYGERVASISEDKGGVDIVTSSGRRIRSRYAVGADGARSTVREHMGVDFSGTKPEMIWAVLDTFIQTDFPTCPEIITFEAEAQSRVSWIPRERGLARFYVLLDGIVSQERAQESINRHIAPYRVEFLATEWYSTFEVKERVASCFVSKDGRGRIVLAGDAAHVHSVNGGQGLNTGIADAFGLAWRLAAVTDTSSSLKDDAAELFLRSYDIERRGTAQGVVQVAAALVRDTVHEAKQYVRTIEKNAGYITGMGVSYAGFDSPLVSRSRHGSWTAGCRCPDVVLQRLEGGGSTRLYTEATYGNFLILLVGAHASIDLGHPKVARGYRICPLFDSKSTSRHSDLYSRGYLPSGTEGCEIFGADWASDDDSFAVVVRPDMYIGHVGRDLRGCKLFLDTLYHRGAQ